ncbi:MAG: AAA family ATPase [Alphaproteobacteria bacterium]
MGRKNYLIEGLSGTGKTTVAEELQRRGYHVIHGDRELKYRGDPKTNAPMVEPAHADDAEKALWQHQHLLWDLAKVNAVITDHRHPISFFCGGTRNLSHFVELLDGVFILEVNDIDVLFQRLDARVAHDPTDWGGKPEEKALVAQLHATQDGAPDHGIPIDATAPIAQVVDTILEKCG